MGDDISATYLTLNRSHDDRSEDIAVDYHFLFEHVTASDIVVRYVPTK